MAYGGRFSTVLALGLFLIGTCAYASIIGGAGDPEIEIDNLGDATPITTNTFTLSSDTAGGGRFSFLNDTNTNWTSLTFIVPDQFLPTLDPAAYNCDSYHASGVSNTFLNCSFTFTSTELIIQFSGVDQVGGNPGGERSSASHGFFDNDHHHHRHHGGDKCKDTDEALGVLAGCAFSIDLDTVQGVDEGGWLTPNGDPITIDGIANAPEPSLGLPLLAVLAAGWRARRPK